MNRPIVESRWIPAFPGRASPRACARAQHEAAAINGMPSSTQTLAGRR
jgi:hypothetical protein